MSLWWSFTKECCENRAVCHLGGLSSKNVKRGWSVTQVVFHKNVVKRGWYLTQLVFHQKCCENRMVCHLGGLSSKNYAKRGWSVTEVVFHQKDV